MKIPDIKEIIVAWHRAFNPTPEQKEIAEYRASVCDTCEHKTFKELIRTHICGACGCPISKKVYSPTSGKTACPKEKWDK
jgi:ribosomal protein L37E